MSMSPSGVDLEFLSLVPNELALILAFLHRQLKSKQNFELVQAWLHHILKVSLSPRLQLLPMPKAWLLNLRLLGWE